MGRHEQPAAILQALPRGKDNMQPKECAVCGSAKMIPDVQVVDKNENINRELQVCVAKKPDALIFRGQVYESVRAWICGECGHVEFFVQNPQELYEAYLVSLIAERQ
jgi:hypothetical protein